MASASVTRDLTNRDQLGILAKRIRLFVVRVVVLGTDPAQPPIIRRAPVSLDDMRGSSPFIAAPLDLAPHAVRATRTHELLVQVAYLVPFITRSMDVLHHGAVVVVVRHSPISSGQEAGENRAGSGRSSGTLFLASVNDS